MPIYEYRCHACGHALEALQKMSATPLVDCPKCAQPQLKRQISAAGFQLKGSGWYATDFKNKPKKTDAGADAKSDSKTDSSGSDTKAASCGTGCGCH